MAEPDVMIVTNALGATQIRVGLPRVWITMTEKPSTTLPATVDKIIKSPSPYEPEKAQITVEGADDLYRELRIENSLTDEDGKKVGLKPGAEVEVTVEADPEATTPKKKDGEV
jgi:uncharacterized protein YfaS (alpha-2-macroglobulin family)